jgi:hypothetical protein
MNKTNLREDGTTESENYWFNQKLPLKKPNNFFRTPDTLEEMQKIVKESNPETMMIVAMVQNFLLKDYNELIVKHNRLCVTLADDSLQDYDEGYQDGWDERQDCLTLEDLEIIRKTIQEKENTQ